MRKMNHCIYAAYCSIFDKRYLRMVYLLHGSAHELRRVAYLFGRGGIIHPSRASLPASTSGPISLLTRPVVPSNLCSLSPRVSAASAHT